MEAKSLAGSRCEHAWRSQRPANDWQGFAENLREVVKLSREEAQIRRGGERRLPAMTPCWIFLNRIDQRPSGRTVRGP